MSRPISTRAFSLVELVIVVVIIGIISAIAIPRLSRGTEGAADNALRGNLAVLRNAIDLFAAEHQGTYPSAATFEAQLTGTTDINGNVGTTAGTHIYGPYIKAIPPLPVGTNKGNKGVAAADAAGVGWLYNETTHEITPNTDAETDVEGNLYTSY